MKRRLHVIQVATAQKNPDLYPYTNFNDSKFGYDPFIIASKNGTFLELICTDLFKLKSNFQKNPKTRMDLYMPKTTALELANDISSLFGTGNLAKRSKADPQSFNQSEMLVPQIKDSFYLYQFKTTIDIAGYTISGQNSMVMLDHELPRGSFKMMVEDEVHMGVFLSDVSGNWDDKLVKTTTSGDQNFHSAQGQVKLVFDNENAKILARTLEHLGSL